MKIKQPITKGHVRVPVVMQMESLECGAATLAMLMAYYDKWVPLVAVAAPLLCLVLDLHSVEWFGGYHFSYELLLMNAGFTILGLLILKKR